MSMTTSDTFLPTAPKGASLIARVEQWFQRRTAAQGPRARENRKREIAPRVSTATARFYAGPGRPADHEAAPIVANFW